MVTFTDDDILKLDADFAKNDIPFHNRPFQAAVKILGNEFSIGYGGNPQVDEIQRAYERLIPEVNNTWPGMGTGLAASLDRVKKVIIGVVFGTVDITIDAGLGFSNHQEWAQWCRGDNEIAIKSAFAFADMHDLVYGINELNNKENVAITFWRLAADQLALVAESLSQTSIINSPILQPICLTAELAMKGTLLHLGIPEKDLRKLFGHNLSKLAQKMIQIKSHRDDELLLKMIEQFPDYVGDRYRETKLTRLQVVNLALNAQFIAASAVRRVSQTDFSEQFESLGHSPRSKYFQ